MSLDWSRELIIVIDESRDLAERLNQGLTSAHLLLCLFTLKNRASVFLSDHQVTADRLLEQLAKRPREKHDTWDRIMRRAEDVAVVSGGNALTSLHVLVALCSFVDSAAYQLMSKLNLDMATIRNTALSYLTSHPDEPRAHAPSDSQHDSGRITTFAPRQRYEPRTSTSPMAVVTSATYVQEPEAEHESDEPHHEPERADKRARGAREPGDVRRRRRREAAARNNEPAQRQTEHPAQRQSGATRSLAARLHARKKERADKRARPKPSRPNAPLPPTVRRAQPAQKPDETPAPEHRVDRRDLVLDEQEFPLLNKLGRNLTLLAFDNDLDDVVGRDDELEQLVDILNKRRSNNPVLVGDPGVGKTAIVEGLARMICGHAERDVVPGLEGKIVVELEASKVVSGTGLRGSFSDRLQKLKAEVARAEGRVVVFLDELHHWIGMGAGGDSAADGAGELKTALARGEFPCIGATTFDEYRKFIESDAAFARRFQHVRVDEPTPDAAVTILRGIQPQYEAHHQVEYDDDAIEAAVRLSHRYLADRRLPDKAISALDLAGSRARRIGVARVSRPLVATVIGEEAGISPDKLLMADRERFLNLEEQLMQRVVGHQTVIERVSHVLRRNYAGFVSGRPIGSFLFLGSTGVGKTEFARALAQVLFQDDSAMVRIDMSEYLESHSVSRLIGSPPGYVGHDAGGQLTEAIRRKPYQLILLDEIEKAHPDVLNLLIQLLDEGRLTDSRGRTVDFSNTVVILTSNLGADAALGNDVSRRVGFGASSDEPAPTANRAAEAAKSHFRPELWNRIDEVLVFEPLSRDEVARIARLQLTRSSRRLLEERRIAFSFAPEVIDFLIESGGYDRELGARPMRRTLERLVEVPIADLILRGDISPPAELEVFVEDGAIGVRELSADGDEECATIPNPVASSG